MRIALLSLCLTIGCSSSTVPGGGDGGLRDLALPAGGDLAGTVPDGGADQAVPMPDGNLDLAGADLAQVPPDLLGLGPGLFGAPCTRGSDCAVGVCLPSGICSHPCSSAADCPAAPEWSCGSAGVCSCIPSLTTETCGGGHDYNCDGIIDEAPTTQKRQFVANSLLMPAARSDYAIDLNGDGHVDNQFGAILGALAFLGFTPQVTANQAVAAGTDLLLVEGRSQDPTFVLDQCAGATVETAVNQTPPDFSGSGHYSVDPALPPGVFRGSIASSNFGSLPLPPVALVPVTMTVKLAFTGGNLIVPLVGVHVQFSYMSGGLMGGQLQGAIRNTDLQSTFIPSLAMSLSTVAQESPCGANCQSVRLTFDTGGCTNPDGTMAVAGDGVVSYCEVAQNAIIQNLLQPDVQMFDAYGNYAPNPLNTNKDSLSVGIGFTAVGATF
jgi:hypothetical protein